MKTTVNLIITEDPRKEEDLLEEGNIKKGMEDPLMIEDLPDDGGPPDDGGHP